MTKQIVNFVELKELYNIFLENKNNLFFELNNYVTNDDLLKDVENNKKKINNSTFLVRSSNKFLLNDSMIDKRNMLVIDNFPIQFNKLIDKINVQLIKQKYNFQSNLNIKNYSLNLNTRTINKANKELKLTEREIDIIMFLKDKDKPQKIEVLQNQIWKYSSELETHTVETHVYRLRKKIKETFNDDNFIMSYDDGYLIQ